MLVSLELNSGIARTASVVGGWVGVLGRAEQYGATDAAPARSVPSQSGAPSHSKIYISRLKFTAQDKLKTSKGSLSYYDIDEKQIYNPFPNFGKEI